MKENTNNESYQLVELKGFVFDRPSTNLWFYEFMFKTLDERYIVVDIQQHIYEYLSPILKQGNRLSIVGYLFEDESLRLLDAELESEILEKVA